MLSKMCQNVHFNGFFRFAVLRRKTSQGVQTMKCNTFYSENKLVKQHSNCQNGLRTHFFRLL